MCEFFLEKRKARRTIIVATSGDTGTLFLLDDERIRRDSRSSWQGSMDIFVLYPTGKNHNIQEKQMTTIMDENVHVIGITSI